MMYGYQMKVTNVSFKLCYFQVDPTSDLWREYLSHYRDLRNNERTSMGLIWSREILWSWTKVLVWEGRRCIHIGSLWGIIKRTVQRTRWGCRVSYDFMLVVAKDMPPPCQNRTLWQKFQRPGVRLVFMRGACANQTRCSWQRAMEMMA